MKLADFLERPAGEIAVAFTLILVGALLTWAKLPKGEDAIVAGLTLVGRALMSHPRPPAGSTTVTQVDQITKTE